MTNLKKKTIFLLTLVFAFTVVACSSSDDDSSAPSSKDVKYEITGNYSGDLDITYTEAGGGTLHDEAKSLPWTKEFTSKSDTALFLAGGNGGVEGETITLKIYVGGKVVRELTATADSKGIIVAVPQPYGFS